MSWQNVQGVYERNNEHTGIITKSGSSFRNKKSKFFFVSLSINNKVFGRGWTQASRYKHTFFAY